MIPIIAIAGQLITGALQAIPLGNGILKTFHKLKETKTEVTTEAGETVKGKEKDDHAAVAFITEVALVSILFWALYTGKIDVTAAIGWLKK